MKLYYHPLSTYSQKVLMGLYEKGVKFEGEIVALNDPAKKEAYRKIHPLGKVPLLALDDGWMIPESAIILEYVDSQFPGGVKLIPDNKDRARQTRFWERMADLYIDDSVVFLFFEGMKPEGQRNKEMMDNKRFQAETVYAGLDKNLTNKTWLMGEELTVADCALIPPLGYAREVLPFKNFKNLSAYFDRAMERPSYQRVMKEAAPYFKLFEQKREGR